MSDLASGTDGDPGTSSQIDPRWAIEMVYSIISRDFEAYKNHTSTRELGEGGTVDQGTVDQYDRDIASLQCFIQLFQEIYEVMDRIDVDVYSMPYSICLDRDSMMSTLRFKLRRAESIRSGMASLLQLPPPEPTATPSPPTPDPSKKRKDPPPPKIGRIPGGSKKKTRRMANLMIS